MILQAMLMTLLASQAPATPNTQPIVADTSPMETSTGTIDAIDQTSRMVTVKYDDGTSADLHAGPKVTRFDQLKVGQRVTFRYYQSTAYQVRKAGAPAPPPTDETAVTPRADTRSGGTMARQYTASVTVLAVNPERPSITVKTGDGHTLTHLVKDKRHLVGVAPGDHVDITYTAAVLASVEPAK